MGGGSASAPVFRYVQVPMRNWSYGIVASIAAGAWHSLFPFTYDATLLFYEDLKPVHLPLHGLGAASNASGQRPPFCIRDPQCLGWSPLSDEDVDDQSSRSWLDNSAGGGKNEREGWRGLGVSSLGRVG